MGNLLVIPIYVLLATSSIFYHPKETNSFNGTPCKQIIETNMGEICIYKENKQGIIDAYARAYSKYIEDKFDPKKYPFNGRKYSNMRLYNIYRFIIHKDGSISDITPIVLEGTEFDEYVKSLILDNPPAPLLEGMGNELKIELEIIQSVATEGGGYAGLINGEYYNIHFTKGKYFDDI